MTYKELEKKGREELEKLAKESRDELFMLRVKNKTGQLDKTHKIKLVKRTIARIETKLGEIARQEKKAS